MWRTGIGADTATIAQPNDICGSILSITTKIIDGCSTNVVAKGEETLFAAARLSIEGIEDRSRRGYGTAGDRRKATGALRKDHIRRELQGWIAMPVI